MQQLVVEKTGSEAVTIEDAHPLIRISVRPEGALSRDNIKSLLPVMSARAGRFDLVFPTSDRDLLPPEGLSGLDRMIDVVGRWGRDGDGHAVLNAESWAWFEGDVLRAVP